MRVAALLGPTVSPTIIEPFRCCDGIEFISQIDESEAPDAALIFGGDGTVHRYLPGLYAGKIPMLVVPKGSGNDFAHAIGVHNEKTALRAWQQFCAGGKNIRDIDVGLIRKEVREILFCGVVAAGLDAEANARANRMPSWLRSSAGYLLAAVQALLSFQPVKIEITTEAYRKKTPALLIAVGNIHRYGGGVKIVPRADVADRLLDVCIVGKISKLKVFFCLPMIYFGSHIRLKEVDYFRARSIQVESEIPLDLYADGELVCKTPVEMSLAPGSLRVIVPAETVLDSSNSNRSW
jgi:diacylglycerol kinase (ATP)